MATKHHIIGLSPNLKLKLSPPCGGSADWKKWRIPINTWAYGIHDQMETPHGGDFAVWCQPWHFLPWQDSVCSAKLRNAVKTRGYDGWSRYESCQRQEMTVDAQG